jgi:hypothetical protein
MHAWAATLGMVVLPVAVVIGLAIGSAEPPSSLFLAVVGTVLAVAASLIASAAWSRQPAASSIELGELMLWSWSKRNRAEQDIRRQADVLGIDETGRRLRVQTIDPAQQLLLLRALVDALEVKDSYTRGHTERVERHAFDIAVELGLPSHVVDLTRRSAAAHDVGKIVVPDEILRKPGPLTPTEFGIMKSHTVEGARLVAPIGDDAVTAAVRHHHERWDGRGYPDGRVAEEIPISARIVAVADAYDALTSTRTYRSKTTHRRAIEILEEEGGRQFDPRVVEAFVAAQARRAGLLLSGIAALLPLGAFARIGSWLRRRASTVVGVGAAIAISVASAFVPSVPALVPVASGGQEGGSGSGGNAHGGSGHSGDGSKPESAPGTQQSNGGTGSPPTAGSGPGTQPPTDTVLGTRIHSNPSSSTSNGPGNGSGAGAGSGSGGGSNGGSGSGTPTPAPAPGSSGSAPGHVKHPGHGNPHGTPPGQAKNNWMPPGHVKKHDPSTDPNPDHGRDCADNPGNGGGQGRMHHC